MSSNAEKQEKDLKKLKDDSDNEDLSPPSKMMKGDFVSAEHVPRQTVKLFSGGNGDSADLSDGKNANSDIPMEERANRDIGENDPDHANKDEQMFEENVQECNLLNDPDEENTRHCAESAEGDGISSSSANIPSQTISSPATYKELETEAGFTTPYASKPDRVNALRKKMAISSPSDNLMSPCTQSLYRHPRGFFRSRRNVKIFDHITSQETKGESVDAEGDSSDDDADEKREVEHESEGSGEDAGDGDNSDDTEDNDNDQLDESINDEYTDVEDEDSDNSE